MRDAFFTAQVDLGVLFARSSTYCVTAGKDRTGIIAAIFLKVCLSTTSNYGLNLTVFSVSWR